MSFRTTAATAELNYVLSNSFGFGGINACVILGTSVISGSAMNAVIPSGGRETAHSCGD